MPSGRVVPWPRRVEIRFGAQLRFDGPYGTQPDRFVLREVTDRVMRGIAALSGQERVDEYASDVKARRAAVTTRSPAAGARRAPSTRTTRGPAGSSP